MNSVVEIMMVIAYNLTMDYLKKLLKVTQSPTLPGKAQPQKKFDVADLYKGPASKEEAQAEEKTTLDEKMRQAYFWITNNAIITPFYDIEYYDGAAQEYILGDSKTRFVFPSGQSYSSFVMLPLLNLVVRRRCLLVGGPGRGKTASAILMGLLAGYSSREVKRAIQHGQPQMTITDLLGNPLPSDLVKVENMDQIRISWRKWLSMRVKIIDEYNRIPTRTQSALLTVMADNYAEIMDQIYECPEAAWYLTANDEAGGGTYQVIEALRDRIDIVVHALHFNSRFIGELLDRIDSGLKPEENIPKEILFTEPEIDSIYRQILEVDFPYPLLRRMEYFAAQFEFFEPAAFQMEYKTKDNVKLSGLEFQSLTGQETGKSKIKDIGIQTLNGFSVRALMTCMIFTKALAYFRGGKEVSLQDLRNMLPFVLHDKLVQNSSAPFFEEGNNGVYRVDKVSWIRKLFDLSCAEYQQLDLDKNDPVQELAATFEKGLKGVSAKEVESELVKIERLMNTYQQGRKLHGPMFDDILKLKYLHQRYLNYLHWLKWSATTA